MSARILVSEASSHFAVCWAEAGTKKAQEELTNYQLVFKYPDQSTVAIQNQIMDDLVTGGVKAIMVSPIDPNAVDTLNKIASQTLLFTMDSDAPKSNRLAYVGSSNTALGEQAGQRMAGKLAAADADDEADLEGQIGHQRQRHGSHGLAGRALSEVVETPGGMLISTLRPSLSETTRYAPLNASSSVMPC